MQVVEEAVKLHAPQYCTDTLWRFSDLLQRMLPNAAYWRALG